MTLSTLSDCGSAVSPCYSISAVLGVPVRFLHVLDPGSPSFYLLVTIWTFCTSICIDLGYLPQINFSKSNIGNKFHS
ncbi:hypothetical protein L208DRAFT_55949 [Tricholoma matsutake]|nr:hypothetical protein L208DRAFT_55949 [Tricholoma matsutake 945]